MIRILKTVPTNGGAAARLKTNAQRLGALKPFEVVIEVKDLPTVDVTEIESGYETALVAGAHVELAQRAELEGFDAVAMGCFLEPGVLGAQQALGIPVVGACQASLLTALMVGKQVGILCASSKTIASIRSLIRSHGLESHVVAILAVDSSPLAFHSEDRTALRAAMLEQGRRALELGADVLIGYGGDDMMEHLRDNLGVPVVSPVRAQVLLAEMLVRMGISTGKRPAQRGAATAVP